jgi:hypothetical protein
VKNYQSSNVVVVAVYSATDCDPFTLSADLKIILAEKTGKSPDTFDVRVINHLLRTGDLFALLYLSIFRLLASPGK